MGIVRMGPPNKLLEDLILQFQIKIFIETGTYYGATAIWASQKFEQVKTIEYSKELYERVSRENESIKNLEFLFGDSRTQLSRMVNQLDSAAIFWLDAHWSGGPTYGDNDQCPLLDEIKIINESPCDHFILIDDARLFLSPPQPPHKIDQWPDISTAIDVLREKNKSKYIVVIDDVILAVPQYSKEVVAKYCQNVNAKAWEDYGKAVAKSDLRKGIELISLDMRDRAKSVLRKVSKRFNTIA